MNNFVRWLKVKISNLWTALFYKDGKLSKTSIFLSLFSLTVLALWIFQSLFVGVVLFGWWTIPAFNIGAAVSVMTIYSALYIVNRSKAVDRSGLRADTKEIARIKKTADNLTAAILTGEEPAEAEDDN